ncbi:alpha/beta fold hydrolase [Alkalicoccus daliensis]|uniref:Pimeloyl-ACP methyl ester carboxylesterase n=1 Tax=Alkalicoccus daliensis TaxID=745820 RepID=A0A1H0E744_9BACI|nr:alpha/beta hydrolase [Alkalicoccus daliensis]SDN78175.1 Pimeloyl-ACP methyl ester carboxylesterase [Alkalicoccus daliensis]
METVISKDATKIAFDKTGQGPALILIGDAFSYRKFPQQAELANLLAEYFTVYNYDRRGRGNSGDTPPYHVGREIEDLQALIEEAGGTAYVWGLSSGAALALRAIEKGTKISKLALHEPPFVVKDKDRKPPADFTAHVTRLISRNDRSGAIRYFMTWGMGAPSFVVGMMRVIPGVWPKLMAVAHTLPYDAAILDGYMNGKNLPASWQHSVQVPTLVIEGTESPASLRHSAQVLAEVLPNAVLLTKKGLGHTKKLNIKKISPELTAFFLTNHSYKKSSS